MRSIAAANIHFNLSKKMNTATSYKNGATAANQLPIQLTPNARHFETPASIKAYFEKVLALHQSGDAFPVSLDDVYPLVYSRKSAAVRVLAKEFVQDFDYQSIHQNVQREIGAVVTNNYRLSVSCMEYFVARKVRTVFDVYREVFHQVANAPKIKDKSCVELAKEIKSLEVKIQRLTEIHEGYISPRVVEVKKDEDKNHKRFKNCRSVAMEIISNVAYRNGYGQTIKDLERSIMAHYHIDVTKWKALEGEHLLDTSYRLGWFEQIYELIKCSVPMR